MSEKQVDSSTISNNHQMNVSLQKKMFSFARSRMKQLPESDQELQINIRQHLQKLLRQNMRLQKQLQSRDRQIEELKNQIKQKDLQVFYLERSQKQLKKSIDNIYSYNQKFITQMDLKNRQIQSIKSSQITKDVVYSNQIAKIRTKYEILKEKYSSLKYESRQQSKNPSDNRPVSPKRGSLMTHIKQYVTQTKAKIRAESKNKQYFPSR